MSNPVRVALIPAYQPGDALVPLVRELRDRGLHVIVVDDGSGSRFDGVFGAAAEYAHVIRYPVNKGKGGALKTGIGYVKDNYPDSVLVTLDADGQHSVEDTLNVIGMAKQNPGKLVLGSRKFEGNVPARSRFGNTLTRIVYHATTGVKVRDTQTGLRAFSAPMYDLMLSISGDRYEYEMNVLLTCSRKHIAILEVDIATIYIDDNSSSHFSAVRDSIRVYGNIIKFALASFVGFLVDYAIFALLIYVTGGMEAAANIGARIVSATVNYTLNKKITFHNKDSVAKTALQYTALAAVILALNTLFLTFLTRTIGINEYVAKVPTEILFFFVNYFIQRYVIFRNRKPN